MPLRPVDAILYPTAVDAGLGELARERDYTAHVEQLMRQVLFTAPGERIHRPDFGCGIRQMIFAPNSEVSAGMARVVIYQALDKWLSSVIRVHDVSVRAIEETLEIRIAYVLLANQEQRYLNLEVTL